MLTGDLGKKTTVFVSIITLILFAANNSYAMDSFFVGPRAMALSGAVVAAPTDTSAQYYNPAAFGFFAKEESQVDNNDMGRKDFGLDVNGGAGYRLHNNFGEYLDQLGAIDINSLSANGLTSESDLRALTNLLIGLDGLDNPRNAITADANASLGVRVGHFGVGAFSFFQSTARVFNIDTTNLGLNLTAADFTVEVNNVTMSTSWSNDQVYTVFTVAQQDQIILAMGGGKSHQ